MKFWPYVSLRKQKLISFCGLCFWAVPSTGNLEKFVLRPTLGYDKFISNFLEKGAVALRPGVPSLSRPV
jgi:hypothetical protein